MCSGLALSSKYSAALTIAGAFLFLLTEATSRRWLSRPHPYVAGLVALILFSPALIWNARHGWVSFLFQGGRAGGHFFPFGPCRDRRRRCIFPALDLAPVGVLRGCRAAPRSGRPGSLAARLSGSCRRSSSYRDLAVEPYSVPLDGARLFDAGAVLGEDIARHLRRVVVYARR